jgi:hypothetical protein
VVDYRTFEDGMDKASDQLRQSIDIEALLREIEEAKRDLLKIKADEDADRTKSQSIVGAVVSKRSDFAAAEEVKGFIADQNQAVDYEEILKRMKLSQSQKSLKDLSMSPSPAW